jgi:hypothetical protein
MLQHSFLRLDLEIGPPWRGFFQKWSAVVTTLVQ